MEKDFNRLILLLIAVGILLISVAYINREKCTCLEKDIEKKEIYTLLDGKKLVDRYVCKKWKCK